MATNTEWIDKRLTQVYDESLQQTRDIEQLRMIIVSDLHKGQRDGADDFERSEATYLDALDHYWQSEFEIVLLGDIEELWECWPKPVISAYGNVLGEEKVYAMAEGSSRYLRIVGNHDDLWYEESQVDKHLREYLGNSAVVEGVRLMIKDDQGELGELFLVHGHQGTLMSDRYRGLSKPFLRYIWRPLQRFLKFKVTTPSNNFELKSKHETAMYRWASNAHGPVLVAGHTHHPVWFGLSYEQALEELDGADEQMRLAGEQVWISQEIGGRIELPGEKPCYFNTGCCSFSDGSLTGIEIADGEIRLVRWGSGGGPGEAPGREVLFAAELAGVLRSVAASS